ncbi:DUF5667 domain-containing protein [Nocardioides sp.]|uniref:DUF5667 domain-containing protein n=1 Tax=Nocardioides sp. TaxID=35761 RepID=UPI00262CAD0F|nr:DUF5667 domain-containing protein [Nocardioides sp.]
MNPVFGSRRRADEFDLLLERATRATTSGSSAPSADPRFEELLGVVATLRHAPLVEPRADFSADLRGRLMAAAETALAPDSPAQSAARTARPVRRTPRERRIAAAVGGFAIVSATGSMAVAAQSSLPGDTLYPLKRAIENAQAGVQRDADGKGTTLLGNASGRLDEVGALSRSGDDDARAIATTLEDFVEQATEASDLLLGDFADNGHASSIEELRTFTADSMGALSSLQSVIPAAARSSLIEASQVINAIDVQAQSLCPACTDLPIMQAPVFAQKTVDNLLDDVLSPLLETVVPATDTKTSSTDKSGKSKKATDGANKAPTQVSPPSTPGSGTSKPDQPVLPQGPAATDDDQGKGTKKGNGGLLDDIIVKGSDDPIGDLLTGTAEIVDDVVKGLGKGLGGLTGDK